MAREQDGPPASAAEALQQWREAERLASVPRRGREAAEVAAKAAEQAAKAAKDTAAAARAALEAAMLADQSATRTAESARLVIESTSADLAGTTADSAQADSAASIARDRYHEAIAEAEGRAKA